MTTRSNPAAVWQATSLLGVCLIIIGIVPAYVEVANHFRSDLFSRHYGIFLLLALVGVVMSSFGLVGWARQLHRGARVRMAALVFISPWIAALLGYPIAGNDVHGPGMLVMVLIIPASVVAIVLLLMAGSPRPPAD